MSVTTSTGFGMSIAKRTGAPHCPGFQAVNPFSTCSNCSLVTSSAAPFRAGAGPGVTVSLQIFQSPRSHTRSNVEIVQPA